VDWARYRERHPGRPEPTAAEPGLPWEIVGAEYARLPGLGSRPGAEPSPVDAKIAPWRAGAQAPAGAGGGDIVVPRGCLVNFRSGFAGAWREHPGASRRLLAALEHVVEHQRRRKADAPSLVQMWGYIMGDEPLPHAAASLRRSGGPPPSTPSSSSPVDDRPTQPASAGCVLVEPRGRGEAARPPAAAPRPTGESPAFLCENFVAAAGAAFSAGLASAPRAEEADGQAAEEECTPPEAQGHHH